jgi:hypothetical protein
MPTSFVGLLIFVVLLAPGFTFVNRRETRFVPRTSSVLRETAGIVLASLVSNGVVLVVFGIVRASLGANTPDVGTLVSEPGRYISDNLGYVSIWAASLLASSTALPPSPVIEAWRRLPDWLQPGWLESLGNPIIYRSAWDQLRNLTPSDGAGAVEVWLLCELHDGTILTGRLYSLNPDVEEDADRELVLVAPIERRPPGGEATGLGVGMVSISSAYLKYVGWSYVPLELPGAGDVA